MLVQNLSNGSKHFIRQAAEGTHKIGGYGMGGWGMGPWGQGYLAVEVSETEPKLLPVALLLEVVIRFWRDFLKLYGPYGDPPQGKVKLSDEQ